jgi:glutamate/tyrosine decarboxylase-like PLP-dependent enzyme
MSFTDGVERIKELEIIAKRLEPGATQRSSLGGAVLEYSENFLEGLSKAPTYRTTEDNGLDLYQYPISEQSRPIDEVLAILSENVDSLGVNAPSPGYLGYIPGGSIYHSALGDYLAAISNRYAGHFYGSPGAVRMENMLLRWMAKIVGYPNQAAGNITSGGSLAQLIAFVTARETFRLKTKDIEQSVVYLTEQTHHSVVKGLHIAGLKECIQRVIPTDGNYRMVVSKLEEAIASDKRNSLNPWLVVGNAGTTNTGAVDPLEKIAEIAKNSQIWYHIDGAYGAFFAICELGKKILHGMDQADSLILDPHKGLFLPYGTGAVLVREGHRLKDAFAYQAAYIQDAAQHTEELSPSELSPELTKHFRGLRLWLPLMLVGTQPFKAALEEKILLARYFHRRLQAIDGFEVGPAPDLSIFTFRYIPKTGNVDKFNQQLVRSIQEDGRIFLSSTTLDGKFVIRIAILAIRTHLDTVDMAIELLKSSVSKLMNQ